MPDPSGSRAGPQQRPGFALLVAKLTLAHAVGTMTVLALPAIAPVAARAFGVSPSMIGYQASLAFFGVMLALVLGGNLSLRLGAVRVNQIGLVLQAAGCALTIVPHLAFLAVGSFSLGIGYGLLTPSASHVLIRFVPPHRRNVVFSLKQAGMPLGGMMASIGTPALTVAFGWQWALALISAALLAMAALLEPGRAGWDDDRVATVPLVPKALEGISIVWRRPSLRLMSIGVALLCASQTCMNAYTVVMFYEQLGYHLVAAGTVLTAAQAGGVCGRLFWGWLADRTRDCNWVLAVLGSVMVCASLVVYLVEPGWPLLAVYALFVVFGSTVSGWNGAYLGEVARRAPAGQVSAATGGGLFFVNVSSVTAPILFANLYLLTGEYTTVFALLGVPTALAVVLFVLARAQARGAREPAGRG